MLFWESRSSRQLSEGRSNQLKAFKKPRSIQFGVFNSLCEALSGTAIYVVIFIINPSNKQTIPFIKSSSERENHQTVACIFQFISAAAGWRGGFSVFSFNEQNETKSLIFECTSKNMQFWV